MNNGKWKFFFRIFC